MRNCDKYSLEEILAVTEITHGHPAVVDGKLVNCRSLSCNACDLNNHQKEYSNCTQEFLVWLYSEAEPEKEANEDNPVNHSSHCTDGKIDVINYIEDKGLGFCLGNAIKCISLVDKKDQTKEVEDLQKAIWYIQRRIEQISKKENNE